MRSLSRSLALALVVLTAGCFQIEQHVSLDRDLSGTADFLMVMDLEVMVPWMATMTRAFSGEQGPPTEEDYEEARQELRQGMEEESEGPPDLEELRQDLPEGVELLDAQHSQEDLITRTSFNFAFDDLRTLTEMSFDEAGQGKAKGEPMGGQESDDPMESPFGNLEVVEEDGTLVIRSVSPVEEVGQQQQEMGMDQAGMMEGMGEAMEAMFEGMRVVFSIEAPFDVVEHNATRTEGDRLVWEYDAEDFEGVMEGQAAGDEGIFVRYRR